MFVVFWPLLKNLGYGLDVKQALVLSWSGLRGAVGLSLSLFVLLDGQISDTRFRTLAFFHMGAVAFLTLIIQGTTMAPLLTVWLSATKQDVQLPYISPLLSQPPSL
jgi:NhaP-type Na+/H+ and K+/H+ antiporter